MLHRLALTAAAATIALATMPCRSFADSFYEGKIIDLYIGYSPGGGYDTYARLVARHLGKHIPGNPEIVPHNMTGGGGRVAAGYMFRVAPKNGTAIATADQSLPLQQAMHDPTVPIDMAKFGWIGSPYSGNNTLVTWHTTGVATVDEAKQKEVTLGATGPNTSAQYPQVMNAVLGTKFKIVTGYPGGNDINLAMERGEVGGRGSNNYVSWKATRPQWLRDHKINILAQIGLKKDKELPNVPLLMDLGKTDEDKALLKLLSSPVQIGRPLFTTPDVPADRLAMLRKAFDDTVKDPDFLADAKKLNLDIDPVSGTELQSVVEDVLASPPKVVNRLATIIGDPGAQTKATKK